MSSARQIDPFGCDCGRSEAKRERIQELDFLERRDVVAVWSSGVRKDPRVSLGGSEGGRRNDHRVSLASQGGAVTALLRPPARGFGNEAQASRSGGALRLGCTRAEPSEQHHLRDRGA